MVNAILRNYPVDKVLARQTVHPLDSDLSGGLSYPIVGQPLPRPGAKSGKRVDNVTSFFRFLIRLVEKMTFM